MPGSGRIRINSYLRDLGVCSRRKADALIESGRVEIKNGGSVRTAILGDTAGPGDTVLLDGKELPALEKKVYMILNKPAGVICSADRKQGKSVLDLVPYDGYLTYAGRLDKDSEGLILLTNDGPLIDSLMRGRNRHEKEYICVVDRDIDDEFIRHMSSGVEILDTVTRPCRVIKKDARTFHIILTQGLNRQIRRMCEALGYGVTYLKRIRIGNLSLGELNKGEYRHLTVEETAELKRICGMRTENSV